jgi:hypothetical protein
LNACILNSSPKDHSFIVSAPIYSSGGSNHDEAHKKDYKNQDICDKLAGILMAYEKEMPSPLATGLKIFIYLR